MNKNIPKNKVYGLIIFALSVACVAAYFGFQYAGELAYEWLNIKAQAAFSSIFDLLGMLSNTTIPTMNKAKIIGAAAIGLAITLAPLIFFGVLLLGLKPREEIYGSASFATDLDIQKAGLLPMPKQRQGQKYPSILIGKYKNKFLHFAGQQFLYLAAPTRSGKGVGIVIPNLLNYADSVVCVDIKFENFLFTAGFREKCGQKVFLFSPDGFAESEEMRKNGEIKSHHYNPLHYIRRDMKYRDGDVQKIVDILFPPNDGDIWKG